MKVPHGYITSKLGIQNLPAVIPPVWLRKQKHPAESLAAADKHAIEVSQKNHASFKDLLYDLIHSRQWSQVETLRVLFRWMTAKNLHNIWFENEHAGPEEEVILGYKMLKSTYGNIFELLCLYSGIPCVTITGYAKGTQFRPGHQFGSRPQNHSWNAVHVDGAWQLIDCHWATRFLKSSDVDEVDNMVYEYDDFYFCADPRQLIYSHFPSIAQWQLLDKPLTQSQFEDLPVAKSHFFEYGMSFLSHHSAVVSTTPPPVGGLALSLGNPSPMAFTFQLVPTGEGTDADGLKKGSSELSACCLQQTRPTQVDYLVAPPRSGAYYFTVYACPQVPTNKGTVVERLYHAVCEFKVIAQPSFKAVASLPPASDSNWGPGHALYASGLFPHHHEAILVASADGRVEVKFDKLKPVSLLAKMRHADLSEKTCEKHVKVSDNAEDTVARLAVELPQRGMYTLEVYANNPDTDGKTFVLACQYLVVFPETAEAGGATPFHQAESFHECYDFCGQKVKMPSPSEQTDQLLRRGAHYALLKQQPHAAVAESIVISNEDIAKLCGAPAAEEAITVSQVPPTVSWAPALDKLLNASAAAAHAPSSPSVECEIVTSSSSRPVNSAPPPLPADDLAILSGNITSTQERLLGPEDVVILSSPLKPNTSLEDESRSTALALESLAAESRNATVKVGASGNAGEVIGKSMQFGAILGNAFKPGHNDVKGAAGPRATSEKASARSSGKAKGGISAKIQAFNSGSVSIEKDVPEVEEVTVASAARLQASAPLPHSSDSPTDAQAKFAEPEPSFPPLPAASQLLTFEIAPARAESEVPVAPVSFEPVKVTATNQSESVPAPEPLPDAVADRTTFSVSRAHRFHDLDTHAVQVSCTEHNSFKDLMWDLIFSKDITDQLEKARLIFLWLCTKDLNKIKFNDITSGSPEDILHGLKDSKSTYAKVYETLCSFAGLHSTVVTGYAKGAEYKPGMSFQGSTAFHSWNAVYIDGHYYLIDCHWASRRIVGKKGVENIRYELDDYYFLVDPRQLIYTHYPEDQRWQLLSEPITLVAYEDRPPIKSLFFRYNLTLVSHTSAIVQADDAFTLAINYQRYVGPGLDFTFSLQTESGEEAVDGVKLNRYGLHEVTSDLRALFHIRCPRRGAFRFMVFAREARQDNPAAAKTYSAIVEYKVVFAAEPRGGPNPFPNCPAATWGLASSVARAAGIVPSPQLHAATLLTFKGEAEVSFKLAKPLLFACHLKSGGNKSSNLPGTTLYRIVGQSTATFSISAPACGEYGFEIFVNDPSTDGTTLRHLCQFIVVCNDKNDLSDVRYPSLPTSYLGPQQPTFGEFGMSLLGGSADPLFVPGNGDVVEVAFALARPIRATSSLVSASPDDDREFDDYVLQQLRNDVLSFFVRPQAAGLYKLQVFAQPFDDVSDSLPGVYNCLVRVDSLAKPSQPYPRQFSAWKEGCYLHEPLDRDIAAASLSLRGGQLPAHLSFRVQVPTASKVAVVVGDEWTHLEQCGSSDMYEGKVNVEAARGVEKTISLTASYGIDSGSFNTLLEYCM